MQRWGSIILGLGLVGATYALLIFDQSVPVADFGRVNNLGLMQDRQNLLIASCVAIIAGLIMVLAARKTYKPDQSESGQFRFLEKETPLEILDDGQSTEVFREFLRNDDVEGVRRMLKVGSVRAYGELPTGRGFLQFAVAHRSLKSIPLLLEGGARPELKDATGKTALQLADEDGQAAVIALLGYSGSVYVPGELARIPVDPEMGEKHKGLTEQLAQLAALRNINALTEEEFSRAKERILAKN